MKNAVEELLKKENVRTNLSNLRAMIKEPAAKKTTAKKAEAGDKTPAKKPAAKKAATTKK